MDNHQPIVHTLTQRLAQLQSVSQIGIAGKISSEQEAQLHTNVVQTEVHAHNQGVQPSLTTKDSGRSSRPLPSPKWMPHFLRNAQGMGDVVEGVAEAMGVKRLVDRAFKKGCGCKARKEALNKLIPFQKENTT